MKTHTLIISQFAFLLYFSPVLPLTAQDASFQSIPEEWQIRAILHVYGNQIQRTERLEGDFVFWVKTVPIYFSHGRMLSEKNHLLYTEFDPFFYDYRTGPLESLPLPAPFPRRRSSDFLDALVGETEEEIRASSRWVEFLSHRVYAHELCIEPLGCVDAELERIAFSSGTVRNFIQNIKIIYSMKRKTVEGTKNKSYHSYGLAIDLIPESYEYKHAYWRWSSVFTPDWGSIPLKERWMPPAQVVESFEKNGFVWGGKWYYFDTVHFEYRPEIIYASQISGSKP
jgi:hypothetical protein